MFSDVIGHKETLERLKNALCSHRIANSYIFSGPTDIGKEFVAVNFAKALNCLSDGEDSCDQCISCRKIDASNHPDVVVIRPEGARVKISQVRSLQRQGSYRAMEGDRKVYIITEADKRTAEAANSMLKTLEEPPGIMVLILLTSVYSALLPTIRSRCQSLKFTPVPLDLLCSELVTRFGVPESKAKWVALRSQGRVGRALKLVKEEGEGAEDEISASLLDLGPNGEASLLDIFRKAEILGKAQDPFDVLLSWYRDLFLVKQGCSNSLLIHSDKIDELEKTAGYYSDVQIEKLIRATLRTRSLIQRNINPNLALEALMLHSFHTLSTRL